MNSNGRIMEAMDKHCLYGLPPNIPQEEISLIMKMGFEEALNLWKFSSLGDERYLIAEARLRMLLATVTLNNMPVWFQKMLLGEIEIPCFLKSQFQARVMMMNGYF